MGLVTTSNSCCDPCSEPTTTLIPGPTGPAGADGTNGTDGVNAFTTASSFIMPAELSNVTVTVADSTWMVAGQIVWAKGGGPQGFFQIVSKPTTTSVILKNLRDVSTDAYQTNSVPTTVFPNGTEVSPGGLQGPEGASPSTSGFLQSANNLNDVADVATSRSNLGLGTTAVTDLGTADGEVPPVDQLAGLTDGDVVFATANGLETLTAAAAKTALGINTTDLDMLLFTSAFSSGTAGGSFTTGAWRQVPLNTEVVDTGNHGSIASHIITLNAGSYRFEFGVVGVGTGKVQGRLYNVADAAVIANSYGTVNKTSIDGTEGSAVACVASGIGRFVLGSTKTIQLEGNCESSNATFGFGSAGSFGGGEVYSFLALYRE